MDKKLNTNFKEMDYQSKNMKNQLKDYTAQSRKIRIPFRRTFVKQQTQSSSSDGSRKISTTLSLSSAPDIYRAFTNGKLLQYFNQNDIMRELFIERFSSFDIMTIGDAYIDEKQVLIVKGPGNLICIVNPDNFSITNII